MELTDEQKEQVRRWAAEGATLGVIQQRLREEFSVSLNYMETRFLVSDLNLTLAEKPAPGPSPVAAQAVAASESPATPSASPAAATPGAINVTLDELTPPHAIISGKVTFSDGIRADWYFDEMGRLALNPSQPGYRPSEADLIAFQRELHRLAETRGL
jgi:hypothetical protein